MLQNIRTTSILKHSKPFLNPNYYLNPRAKTFTPISIAQTYVFINTLLLNPHANDFIPKENFLTSKILNPSATGFVHNQNTVVSIFDPCAAMFISTYKLSTPMLNSYAKVFIPRHRVRIGIYMIQVILVFILILIFLVCSILNITGMQYGDELAPKILNKLIIGHLNINSIRYKCECRCNFIDNNIDILLISETKLNDTFPNGQFIMNGFHPLLRKDRTDKG